ncbi:MAG: NAD-dependent protein deacetylase [Candidatus Scalindua rubra]|uniref:protein acetyllysine N-acetyltransferase n=1 Tax=Candidatus Scalindua rubra TaxID=1872076 RepID=A0A1E3XA89_9BACT|nr:MAG: NAD-dependent protein deacetylase [Candidatus Scalindua rubra]
MSNINTNEQIIAFKSAIDRSKKIVGFTGAGISTESGIPDYRSKGGIWDKFQPVYFEEFVSDEKKRILYWQRKQELWDDLSNASTNKGHMFFKHLYDEGKLVGLITQNIDGLHEKSGLPKDIIVNLHGTNLEVVCLDCGFTISSEKVFDNLDLKQGVPLCPKCEGLLKPNTISFGQQLRGEDLDKANNLALSCDLMIVVGSTLVVQPASSIPSIAKENGALLAIVTLSETPLDGYADFVFHLRVENFINLIQT